jgi:hypothetical protein
VLHPRAPTRESRHTQTQKAKEERKETETSLIAVQLPFAQTTQQARKPDRCFHTTS